MAKLMKRNEELEAEVAQLKEELKAKTREATESTQATGGGVAFFWAEMPWENIAKSENEMRKPFKL